MGILLDVHGDSMESLWPFLWYFCGGSLGFLKVSMIFLLDFYAISMRFLLDSYKNSIGFSGGFSGISIIFVADFLQLL